MSWPATLGVALAVGLAGMVAAGYTADLAVSWYRISTFEGKSGYFVAALGLAGFVLGFVVGIVVSRLVNGSFLHALTASLGVVLGLTVLTGGAARLHADVPPTIAGDTLLLALEYRWPASQIEAPTSEDVAHVRLVSTSGNVERKAEIGAFWLEDSRHEHGRWISPAAVQLFTERGGRAVSFVAVNGALHGTIVPLPRRPDRKYLQWSGWLPADAEGSPDGASYRFRVHRASEPIRVEQSGPFDIETRAEAFWMAQDPAGPRRVDAVAALTIRHNGEPVVIDHPGMYGSAVSTRLAQAVAVAVVQSPRPALLACMNRYDQPCFLLVSEDAGVRTEHVPEMSAGMAGYELTSDPARYELLRHRDWPHGRLDRTLFEQDRIYQLGAAILDTRGPRVLRLQDSDDLPLRPWIAAVGLAPDGQTFARIGGGSAREAMLVVTELDGSNAYTVPIDAARTRDGTPEEITPTWVMQHFEWIRDSNGVFRLVARSSVH